MEPLGRKTRATECQFLLAQLFSQLIVLFLNQATIPGNNGCLRWNCKRELGTLYNLQFSGLVEIWKGDAATGNRVLSIYPLSAHKTP